MKTLAAFVLLFVCSATAQIPPPAERFGFRMGTEKKLIDWKQITEYFHEVDSLSPRVRVETIGKSTLGKPFILAIVSSEEAIAHLERYRQIQHELAHPEEHLSRDEMGIRQAETGQPDEQTAPLPPQGKTVVLITLNIHSTEIASSQESVELLHELATLETPLARKIRDSVIVLIVPSLNPDGQQIVTDWYRKTLGTAAEGSAPPELYHHYAGHDNNRDWFMYNLVESRNTARVLYHEWFPEIVYDQHQMGSAGPRLFLPPYEDPVNPNVPAALTAEVNLLGKFVVADLHRQGFEGVATGTVFNAYFEGTMSKTPLWHNRIGILSEAASAQIATPIFFPEGSVRGLGAQLPENKTQTNYLAPWNGGWWGVREIIDYEKAATWSLLDFAASFKEKIKTTFYQLNKTAVEKGLSGPPYGYVITPDQRDPGAAVELVNRLLISGVAVDQLEQDAVHGWRTIPAGSFAISLAQPARSYVKDLMEAQRYPELLQFPGGPPRTPYDVTAWTMPLMLGVDILQLDKPAAFKGNRLVWNFDSGGAHGRDFLATYPSRFGLKRAGAAGADSEGEGAHYVVERSHTGTHALVHDLLRRGVDVFEVRPPPVGAVNPSGKASGASGEAADASVTSATTLPAGTILIPASALTQAEMAKISGRWTVPVFVTDGASGTPADSDLTQLAPQRIAIYQPWNSSMDEGWTRLIMDTLGISYSVLHKTDIKKDAKLARSHDVLILPDLPLSLIVDGKWSDDEPSDPVVETPQWPEEYRGGIGADGVEAIKSFVQEGGTLIAFGAASDFAIEKLRVPASNALKDVPEKEFYAPGTILRMTVDTLHPLAYGMGPDAHGYITDPRALGLLPYRYQSRIVASFADENVLSSGWILGGKKIEGKIAMAEIPYGKGRVVMYAFRVQHRAQTYGTFKLFLNALLAARRAG